MNYVSHTRAAHQQLASQADARPQHVSLYWVLFFQWNASHFAELDHDSTMQTARIGSIKTYRATLYDLETWGLLSYQPSKSRHYPSTCQLTNLSGAEVAPVNPVTEGRSAPDKNPVTEGTSALGKTRLPGAEVPPINDLPGAVLPQDSLLGKTVILKTPLHQNVGGGTHKKKWEGSESEGLSSAEVLDENRRTAPATAPPDDAAPPRSDGPGAAPKKKVAPKKMRIEHSEGVREQVVGATATAQNTKATSKPRGGRRKLPETTFQESAIYDKQAFTAAFQGTNYELADLNFYHEKVNIWRDKKTGEPPRRADWVATAKRFMLNDAEDNRLKLAPAPAPQFGAGNPHSHSGGPDTGYRTSRWD